jgi:cytosine/adenosine deaminase-related metal-dependent hydrolase
MTDRDRVLLVRGGFLYTADENATVHRNGSVLAIGGVITAMGDAATVDRAVAELDPVLRDGMRTIDAGTMMILPGFVNAHWHEVLGRGLARFAPGAADPFDDRLDAPGPFARGGDVRTLSVIFDGAYSFADAMTPDEAAAVAEYSLLTQLRSGTTTIGDVGSMNRPEALVDAVRALGMRGALGVWASDGVCAPGESRFRRTRDAAEVLARLESVRTLVAADGTGRLRTLPSAIYPPNMSDELGTGLAAFAERHGLGLATHLAALPDETPVTEQYFGTTPVRRAAKLGLLTDRLLAVHCGWFDDEERRLLVDAGVHVNHSPVKYGTTGESPMSGKGMMLRLARDGLTVSLSTDGEGLPVGGMAEAMTQTWLMHNELASDNTAVVPTTALAMATRHAAKALRWDGEIGSLTEGRQADLVLVPVDDWRYLLRPRPLEGFLLMGGSRDVHTVVVGGEFLVEAGLSTRVDETGVRNRFVQATCAIAERIFGADSAVLAEFAGRFARHRLAL